MLKFPCSHILKFMTIWIFKAYLFPNPAFLNKLTRISFWLWVKPTICLLHCWKKERTKAAICDVQALADFKIKFGTTLNGTQRTYGKTGHQPVWQRPAAFPGGAVSWYHSAECLQRWTQWPKFSLNDASRKLSQQSLIVSVLIMYVQAEREET